MSLSAPSSSAYDGFFPSDFKNVLARIKYLAFALLMTFVQPRLGNMSNLLLTF
jgi:hypothetical protein